MSRMERELSHDNQLSLSVNCHWVDTGNFCFVGWINTNAQGDMPGLDNAAAQKEALPQI